MIYEYKVSTLKNNFMIILMVFLLFSQCVILVEASRCSGPSDCRSDNPPADEPPADDDKDKDNEPTVPTAEDLALQRAAAIEATCDSCSVEVDCRGGSCSVETTTDKGVEVEKFNDADIKDAYEKEIEKALAGCTGDCAFDPDAVNTDYKFDPLTGEISVDVDVPTYDPGDLPDNIDPDDVSYNPETEEYEYPNPETGEPSTIDPVNWERSSADPVCGGEGCSDDMSKPCEGCQIHMTPEQQAALEAELGHPVENPMDYQVKEYPNGDKTLAYDSDGDGVLDAETCGGCAGNSDFNGPDGQVGKEIPEDTLDGSSSTSLDTEKTFTPTEVEEEPETGTVTQRDTEAQECRRGSCSSTSTCTTECGTKYTISSSQSCTRTYLTHPGLYPPYYGDPCCAGIGQCKVCSGVLGCSGTCNKGVVTNPPLPEDCNNIDDNCNGIVDENLIHKGPLNILQLGVCENTQQSCYLPSHIDPNKNTAWINDYNIPNYEATEVTCDGLDNDCDGATDESCDDDLDGFIDSSHPCTGTPKCSNKAGKMVPCRFGGNNGPACNLGIGTDCLDTNYLVNPGMNEICDTLDNDCDDGYFGWSLLNHDLNFDTGIDEGCDDDRDTYAESTFGCDYRFLSSDGNEYPCTINIGGEVIPRLDCDDTQPLSFNRKIDPINNKVCADGIWVNLS